MNAITKLLIALTLLLLFAAPAYADGPINYPGFQKDPEQEYYRGIYDVCLWAISRAGVGRSEAGYQCLMVVNQAERANWYELPSRGWKGMERLPPAWGSEV